MATTARTSGTPNDQRAGGSLPASPNVRPATLRTYRRLPGGKVWVDYAMLAGPSSGALDPRPDLGNGFVHAETRLALALLADALGDDARATRLCLLFRLLYLNGLGPEWELTSADVRAVVDDIEQNLARNERPA